MRTTAEMREQRLVSDLTEALGRRDQLSVHYMPTVALATGACTGVEALVRWEHPGLGSIPPSDFVPVAERNGLASMLGDYVRAQVMSDAVAGRLPSRHVAVNVSGIELSDAGFADGLLDLLERHGMAPADLTIEVTETAMTTNLDSATEALLRVRAAGVGVAIDDFGTGHASLAYLANLPCDIVKIDRTFTAGLGTDRRCTAIVHGVISMGHALGLRVIAEGVESISQRDQLATLECEEGQGYLFGKAAPVDLNRPHHLADAFYPARVVHATLHRRRGPSGGQVLLDLSRDLQHCRLIGDAFARTLLALRQSLTFTGGSIQLLGDDGIRLAAAHPPPSEEALSARLPKGQGVGGAIIASHELRYIPDITAFSSAPSPRRRSTTRDTRSYLGVPLLVGGAAIGLLQIDSVDVDAFDAEAEVLLAGCAGVLAPIVEALCGQPAFS